MHSIINWKPLATLPSDYEDCFIIAKIKDNDMQAMYTALLGNHVDTGDVYIKVGILDISISYTDINAISIQDGEGMVWAELPNEIYSKQ